MHKHLFKNLAGGCEISGGKKYPCDVEYRCICGEKFTLLTTASGYGYLPESFETQEWSETKTREQGAITDAMLGINLTPSP